MGDFIMRNVYFKTLLEQRRGIIFQTLCDWPPFHFTMMCPFSVSLSLRNIYKRINHVHL